MKLVCMNAAGKRVEGLISPAKTAERANNGYGEHQLKKNQTIYHEEQPKRFSKRNGGITFSGLFYFWV